EDELFDLVDCGHSWRSLRNSRRSEEVPKQRRGDHSEGDPCESQTRLDFLFLLHRSDSITADLAPSSATRPQTNARRRLVGTARRAVRRRGVAPSDADAPVVLPRSATGPDASPPVSVPFGSI